VNADVVNGGAVNPGSSPGTLTITGSYTQTAAGALNLEIAGLTPGTQYDVLAISGPAALDGALNVSTLNGFLPNFGDAFQVVTFASHSGDFATLNGLDLGHGRRLDPVYDPSGLDLSLLTVSTNRPPVLDAIPDQSVDEGGVVAFTAHATDPDPGQTLTYSLDAGAPAGASIDPVTGAFTFAAVDGPNTYPVTVRVTDDGDLPLSTARTFDITVNNVPPSVVVPADATVKEGSTFTGSGSFTDPGINDSPWTATGRGPSRSRSTRTGRSPSATPTSITCPTPRVPLTR
jgi:hypothetical protein